ncbi:MAG: ABC transporter permease [Rhodoferax ferrireducens]|uniref:ABC transporter permease n=1 Tax=Rhodoferax ferrireducens TaxID=192843 RepID=A0A1W9KT25_9BURK|nr:MAG: ABC transporter permease [Rhodoferax ferrireducens]
MFELLTTFSWQELRQHPWRNAAAVLAVMLGVALAFSVHLINSSALDEFAQAARSVGGQSDLELRGVQGHFDEKLYKTIAQTPGVAVASPLLEVGSYVMTAQGKRSLRVVGVDALSVFGISPDLMPVSETLSPAVLQPDPSGNAANPPRQLDRWALFTPGQIFLNAAARRIALPGDSAADAPFEPGSVSPAAKPSQEGALKLQSGMQWLDVSLAGSVRASGPALAVMDLGAAQDLFGKAGQLTRIDLRLQPGVDRKAFAQQLQDSPDWPRDVTVALPEEAESQINNLSRAYRVNLTVLALIALFTGAFLVFSVLSLSVAKRAQQFALLGVLGLSGRNRLKLVLWESLALGLVGSLLGLGLGTGLAALALGLLGGDLGSGFFSGATPSLQFSPVAALIYGALGVAAALVGGWWPARAAQQLPPAQTLKGLGSLGVGSKSHWISLILIAGGALLTWAPPVFGIPLAAYIAIGLLLVGGITALPWLIGLLLGWLAPRLSRQTLPLLAVERARRQRDTAAVAVSGVVASLSLAVALTVMVASFRDSVISWLDRILPADLYVRSAAGMGASDTVYFSPEFVLAASQLQGVTKLQPQRMVPLSLQASLPAVALLARDLGDPAQSLPLLDAPLPVPAGMVGVYVSQAMVDLHGAQAGQTLPILSKAFRPLALIGKGQEAVFYVAGVWRDYARQSGSIAIDLTDFQRLTGDRRANDLALWLDNPTDTEALRKELQALAANESGQAGEQTSGQTSAPANAPPARGNTIAGEAGPSVGGLLEFGTSAQIRAISLKIFDRSFAVTYWLQSVAIAIGLFGIAASFSAQVLSRRKEFGLLAHLGLTRRQILTVVALEGTAWTSLGAIAGLGLGLVVAVVLVHVVNPQSFHWTMDLMLPWQKLLTLCLVVVAAGTVTAWLAARAAAGKDAVLAVKEDW